MNNKEIEIQKFSFTRLNKRLYILVFILVILYFFIQIFAVAVSNTYQNISYIRSQKEQLRKENEKLVSDIGKAQSYLSAQDVIEKYKLTPKNLNYIDYIDTSQAINEKK